MNLLDLGLGAILGMLFGGLFSVFMYILMGQEGRFHLKRLLKGKGIDLIASSPLSGKIRQTGIKWNGKNWVSDDKKNQGFFFGLESLVEKGVPEKLYNSALKHRVNWEGCKRSVVFGVNEMCFVYTPEFVALLTKSLEKLPKDVKAAYENVVANLNVAFESGVTEVYVIQTIDPSVITRFMDRETPRRMQEAHDGGRGEAALEFTKPKKELGGGWKLGIGVGVIILVVVLLIAVTQGDAVRAMIQGLLGKK